MERDSSGRKIANTALAVMACFSLLWVSGCAQTGGVFATDTATETAGSYVPEAGLSAFERRRRVLELLEEGNEPAARTELELYLEEKPNSKLGRDLLAQIDMPASDYFPEDYREVELESGQSLSNLSKDYLGSVYKFHALAKYNQIAEPRKLVPGQTVRIPLTSEALIVFAQEDGQPIPTDPESVVVPVVESEMEAEVVEVSDVEVLEVPDVEVAEVPDVAQLHREALNAYRAQDLSRAIELWDQVLAVEPDYENASLYRSQAIQLQNRLRNLK